MNKLFKVFAILFLVALARAEVEEEEGVLVLTEKNFDEVIAQNQYVLVEFYAPWCGHCKSLAPEYALAAKALKDVTPKVLLGKVDATKETALGTKFGVKGYPTLKFFINGDAIEYTGGRTQDTIISWVKKRTGESSTVLNTVEEVNKFKEDNKVAVVFFGEQGTPEHETYSKVSKSMDEIAFGHTFSAEVKAHFKIDSQNVVLYKHFDELVNYCNCEFKVETIKEFIENYRFPTILDFDQGSAQKIFGEEKTCLFVFANEDDKGKAAKEALKDASEFLKGKILMSISQVSDGIGKRLGDYVGVLETQLPTVRIVTPSQKMQKFVMEGAITKDTIIQFFNDWKDNKLKPHFKSEEIPEKNDEPVKVLVGKNFEKVVLDSTKDVLVEFYAPWCGHCKSLAPIYDELAKKLLVNPHIVIAKMDATANEVESVQIQGFPTLKYYPSNNKLNPTDYSGDRNEEGFLKFLKQHTTFPWVEVASSAEPPKEEEKKPEEEPKEKKEDL